MTAGSRFIPRFWRAEGSGRATLAIIFAVIGIVAATIGGFLVYRQLALAELTGRDRRALSSVAEQLAFRINGVVEATENVSRGCFDGPRKPTDGPHKPTDGAHKSDCLRDRIPGEIPGAAEVPDGRRRSWLEQLYRSANDNTRYTVFLDGHGDEVKLLFVFATGASGYAAFEVGLGDVLTTDPRRRPFEWLLLTDAHDRVVHRSGTRSAPMPPLFDALPRSRPDDDGQQTVTHVTKITQVRATAPGRREEDSQITARQRCGANDDGGCGPDNRDDHARATASTAARDGYSTFTETVVLRDLRAPLRLRNFADGSDIDELRIVGISRSHDRINESSLVPPLFAGGLLIAVFLLLATWPLVQLLLVGPAERVRRRNVWLMAVGGYFALGVATFVVFSVIEYNGLRSQFDATAVELGDGVASRLCQQLHGANAMLEEAFRTGDQSAYATSGQGLLYPFEVFLVDDDGNVLQRWRGVPSDANGGRVQLEPLSSTVVNVADRQYYIDADAGVVVGCAEQGEESSGRFSVEVIRSRTTGRPTVTVARRASVTVGAAVSRVAAMSVPIMSVSDAVLPPGFAYAIVDRNGDTLFHSNPRRSKVENLFAETRSDALEAAIRFRSGPSPITVTYFGAPTRVHVRPIFGLDDWTVVILEDLSVSRSLYGLLMSESAVYFVGYSLILWAFLIALRLLKPEPRSWLWPRSDRGVAYVRSGLLIVLGLAVAAPTPFVHDRFTTAAAAGVLPALTLCVLLINLRWLPGQARKAKVALAVLIVVLLAALSLVAGWPEIAGDGWIVLSILPLLAVVAATPLLRWWVGRTAHRYSNAYIALVFLALSVLAAVPAAAFFRLACSHALETHVRFSQIELLRGLLDATLRARRGFEGDWPRDVAERVHDLVTRTSDQPGMFSPIDWVDVFGGHFNDRAAWDAKQRCCCCREGGYRCTELCATAHVNTLECARDALDYDPPDSRRLRWRRPITNPAQGAVLSLLSWVGLNAGDTVRIQAALESAKPAERDGRPVLLEPALAVSDQFDSEFDFISKRMWVAKSFDEADLCLVDARWKSVLGVPPQSGVGFTAAVPTPTEPLAFSFLLITLLAAVMFWVVSYVVRRLFVLLPGIWRNESGTSEWSAARPAAFLLVRPVPDPRIGDPEIIDMREWDRPDAGSTRSHPVVSSGGTVILDNIDNRLDAPELTRHKLDMIESLLKSRSTAIVLVSAVDLVSYFSSSAVKGGSGAGAGDDTDSVRRRWAWVLSHFESCRVPLDVTPDVEHWLGKDLVELLRRKFAERSPTSTTTERWARWNALTAAEKLALTQLAMEGYANFRAGATLRMLLQRGLIKTEPYVSIVDKGIERFVRKTSRYEPISRWEREAGPRLSDLLGIPLLIAVVVAMAILFTTQNDLALKAGSVLTAIATLLPMVFRIVGNVSGDRLVKKADDGTAIG